MPLIGNDLIDVLVSQLREEIYNSHLYLTVEIFFKNRGLDNLAGMFKSQWHEEQEHSEVIRNLLTDLNVDFAIPAVEGCENMSLNSLSDVSNLYLRREIITTQSLNEIKELAMESIGAGAPVVEQKIREMISWQQAELEEATTFSDKVSLIGDNWGLALIWDASLGD